MGEVADTAGDAVTALGGTPTEEEVYLATRDFSAREVAAAAAASAAAGGGGGGGAGLSSFSAADGSMTVGGTLTDPTVAVHPDGSTLETGGGVLRVKDAGVTEAKLSTSDVTTGNASTSKHGFLKKLSGTATDFLGGTGLFGALPALLRTVTVAYAATVTPNTDTTDVLNIGALTGNITIANPTGTPVDGQNLRIRFLQDGTGGRSTTWGANFAFGTDVTTALIPTTASAKYEMLVTWHATDSKWRAMAITRGF